jgi:hypothetical protein
VRGAIASTQHNIHDKTDFNSFVVVRDSTGSYAATDRHAAIIACQCQDSFAHLGVEVSQIVGHVAAFLSHLFQDNHGCTFDIVELNVEVGR